MRTTRTVIGLARRLSPKHIRVTTQRRAAGSLVEANLSVASSAILSAPATFFEKPTYLIMQSIDMVHSTMNVPYWEAIVMITLAVRVAMLPMSIMQIKTMATLASIKPEIDKMQATMMADPDKSSLRTKHYENEMKLLFQRRNFNPIRMWMPFLQLPIFVGFFVAIREMGDYFPGFRTGGFLWFQDLAGSDSTYVLPVLNGMSMLLMFEMGAMSNPQQANPQQAEIMKWVMRAASVAMIPLMISMPNGLFVHWGVNNVYTMAQTAILSREDVKRYLGIPKIPAAISVVKRQT